jgi:hypothetical protein
MIIASILLALSSAFTPTAGKAVDTEAPAEMMVVASAGDQQPANEEQVVESEVRSGLSPRPADPRTLREFWPVFVGFVIAWLGIVGYLLVRVGRHHGAVARAAHRPDASA